jgi:predicted AAA+ superfamily ATPase
MKTLSDLQAVIEDNSSFFATDKSIVREKKIPLSIKPVVVVAGVRRCGKSILLQSSLTKKSNRLYLNFEDTRLEGFEFSDFNKIEQIAKENKTKYIIFDEIQAIEGWEKFVRSLHDKGYHVFVTGSNASMLSRELGTRLTGRYLQAELFPFSYNEFLSFRKAKPEPSTFREYLNSGGFPEFLMDGNPEYLRTLLKDIVVRDIVVRRGIRNEHVILRLAMFLMSNVGKEISYNNISRVLEIKSVRTTIDYCDYLTESYLFDFVPMYSRSIKKQIANPKKVYSIDTGMVRANSLSFSEDLGRMLENTVYLHLRRNSNEVFYFRDDRTECDFLTKKLDQITGAVQVCWQLTEDNLRRELSGLKAAMDATKTKNGVIVTFDQEDHFDGIKAIPVWKWLKTKK